MHAFIFLANAQIKYLTYWYESWFWPFLKYRQAVYIVRLDISHGTSVGKSGYCQGQVIIAVIY